MAAPNAKVDAGWLTRCREDSTASSSRYKHKHNKGGGSRFALNFSQLNWLSVQFNWLKLNWLF
jgi:hypothetical protein